MRQKSRVAPKPLRRRKMEVALKAKVEAQVNKLGDESVGLN